MRTIEQNFKKNPHTARFLMSFHSAAYGLPSDIDENQAEIDLAAQDLLDEVDIDVVADHRTEGQTRFMENLIGRLVGLDPATGQKAREYTDRMTAHGAWTAGHQGNASGWINRMIAKEGELKAAAPRPERPVVADGRYAVEHEGVLKFFRVKNGRKPGFVFLDVQASDDLHSIRNPRTIAQVLALIAVDPEGALCRYGQELGVCGRCGKVLTDEASRKAGIGPICQGRM